MQIHFLGRNGPLDIYAPGTFFPLIRCVAGFSLGVIAFQLTRVPQINRFVRLRWAGTAALCTVLLLTPFRRFDIVLVILFVPLVMTLAQQTSMAASLLSWKPILWLGTVSYSVYILHFPMDLFFRQPLAALLPHRWALEVSGLAALILLLFVSALTFRFVEDPARRLLRRYIRPAASSTR